MLFWMKGTKRYCPWLQSITRLAVKFCRNMSVICNYLQVLEDEKGLMCVLHIFMI